MNVLGKSVTGELVPTKGTGRKQLRGHRLSRQTLTTSKKYSKAEPNRSNDGCFGNQTTEESLSLLPKK